MAPSAFACRAALPLLLAVPTIALAHPGHPLPGSTAYSFAAGLMHPLTGLDHLCAMVVLGVWSAMTTRRAWLAPLSFVLALLAGALLGTAGMPMPVVEPMVAVSLLALGLLTAARARLSEPAGMAVAALFAVFHGHAHGTELPESVSAALYFGGFLLATATLHGAGIAGGFALRGTHVWLARILGGGVAFYGLALLAV